jgi:hypothetical protein
MAWKTSILFFAGAVLISASLLLTRSEPVQGQPGKMFGGARHSVVSTDGAHLIVTDNAADKLYFYAIDKDGKVGDELKLRGSADLSQVGQPSIKPIDAKPQK